MRRLRVYADTSVYGGVFDDMFEGPSLRFFEQVRAGRFVVLVSAVTLREIRRAPAEVQRVLDGLPEDCVELIGEGEEADALAEAYLATGVLREGAGDDALHVATATVAGADLILSWNFRDILRYDRKRMFHGISVMRGYHAVDILSPLEVDYGGDDAEGV